MKCNFDHIMTDIDGTVIPLSAADKSPLLLKQVCTIALTGNLPGDDRVGGEEKFNRYKLAMKIHDGGEVELTPEEAAKIKHVIGLAYGPVIVGRAFEVLNG